MQKLKINDKLLPILKNFNKINPELIFRPGKRLITRNPKNTLVGATQLDFEITEQFIIGDLSSFLTAYSLFNDPTLYVTDREIVIEGVNNKLTYKCGSSKLDKGIKGVVSMPPIDVQFNLPATILKEIDKAASLLNAPEVIVVGDEGIIFVRVTNPENPSATSYEVNLNGETKHNFNAVISIDRMIFEPNDYEVKMSLSNSKNMVAHFHSNLVEYWLALQATSTFNKENTNE